MHVYNITVSNFNLLPPAFFVTACPVCPDSHKSGANVWKDFVLCFVHKQAHKRTYTIVSYPTNLVLAGTFFANHKVRCGGNFLLRISLHTSACICSVRTYIDWTIAATT